MARHYASLAGSTSVLVISVVAIVIGAQAMNVKDCTPSSGDGQLEHVSISGCDFEKDSACDFIRGTNVSMEVKFTTKRPFSQAKVNVFGKIGRLPIPFPIKPDDACSNYQVNCPSKVGQEQDLKISLPILKSYPNIQVMAVAKLVDERRRTIVCLEFPIKIKDQ